MAARTARTGAAIKVFGSVRELMVRNHLFFTPFARAAGDALRFLGLHPSFMNLSGDIFNPAFEHLNGSFGDGS